MANDEDAPIPIIILVVVFYIAGLFIAFYIRIRKILLVKQIQKTGRVVSLSQTIISILMQQLHETQRTNQISPATGLPAPPPYTIEPPTPPPITPDEMPPPYTAPPPYVK